MSKTRPAGRSKGRLFRVRVGWSAYAEVEVRAKNEEDARLMAGEPPLPNDWEYVDNSFGVDEVKAIDGNPISRFDFSRIGRRRKKKRA